MESNEWTLDLELRRKPSERKKGPIDQPTIDGLLTKLCKLAYTEGYVLFGMPKPKRTNCPHCGRILRGGVTQTRCPMCGLVLT